MLAAEEGASDMANEKDRSVTTSDDEAAQEAALAGLVQALSSRSRKDRQNSAHVIAQIAEGSADRLVPHIDALVEALSCPEAQTRWETMTALTSLAVVRPDVAEKAAEAAEECLYDEESGMLRFVSFRFFSKLAGADHARSRAVWPLLDEALQCYHGDQEFPGMLDCIVDMLQTGDVDQTVREKIADRMRFDAGNGKNPLASRSRKIVDLCKAGADGE